MNNNIQKYLNYEINLKNIIISYNKSINNKLINSSLTDSTVLLLQNLIDDNINLTLTNYSLLLKPFIINNKDNILIYPDIVLKITDLLSYIYELFLIDSFFYVKPNNNDPTEPVVVIPTPNNKLVSKKQNIFIYNLHNIILNYFNKSITDWKIINNYYELIKINNKHKSFDHINILDSNTDIYWPSLTINSDYYIGNIMFSVCESVYKLLVKNILNTYF